MIGPALSLLLLLLLIGGLIGGEVLARLLPGMGWPNGKRFVRIGMLVGALVYFALLLGTSLSSHEDVLAHTVPKRFCGFYLDCHLAVDVEDVERRPVLGTTKATGLFYVVTIRVSSDAKRETLRMGEPEVVVLDDAGKKYSRSIANEGLLTDGTGVPFAQPVQAGSSFLKRVVFDLPAGVSNPRLLVKDVRGVDVVLESLLIGDEDSLLHRPTTFKL
jgi:hypothetical protein